MQKGFKLKSWLLLWVPVLSALCMLPERHAIRLSRVPQQLMPLAVFPVVKPVQMLSAWIKGNAASADLENRDPNQLQDYRQLLAEANWRIEQLSYEKQQLSASIKWYEDIRPLITAPNYHTVIAPVSARVPGYMQTYIGLDRGQRSGLEPGCVVIGSVAGQVALVGQIADKPANLTSEVMLLSSYHKPFQVIVYPPFQREFGGVEMEVMALEDGVAPGLLVGRLSEQHAVSVGDEVILADHTFGMHAHGLLVGTVEEIEPSPERPTLEQLIWVRPAIAPGALQRVMVLIEKKAEVGYE